jgi:hypothetical protein
MRSVYRNADVTENSSVARRAGLKLAFPACVATIAQVPGAIPAIRLPEVVQTLGVVLAIITGRPEEVLASI